MSQPEKQPDAAPASEIPVGRPGDLVGGPFPRGDWGAPGERLEALYRRVERDALRTVDWYLADRVPKRRAARALRLLAGLGAAAGTALPLLDLAGVAPAAGWGYLALLAAVACVAADRYFGLTSGWMRDVAAAQSVQRRLEALRYDWAAEHVRAAVGPAETSPGESANRCLGLLRQFSAETGELVRAETTDWMIEFRCGAGPLRMQGSTPAPGSPPAEPATAAQRRPTMPGAARPAMPRQRPPEGPGR